MGVPWQVSAAKEQLETLGHRVKWGLDVSRTAADWRNEWMRWCARPLPYKICYTDTVSALQGGLPVSDGGARPPRAAVADL